MKKTAEKAVDIFKIQSQETTQRSTINISSIKSGRDLEYGEFGYRIPYFVYVEGRKGPMKIATSIEIKKDDVVFIKNLTV